MLHLRFQQPILKLLALHEGVLESAGLHKFFPLWELAYFLENVGVIGHLRWRGFGRHENATQHQVLHIEALRFAGGNVFPRLGRCDFFRIRHDL